MPKYDYALAKGVICFTATYASDKGFHILSYVHTHKVSGDVLSGCFDVEIIRPDNPKEQLPSLYLNDVDFEETPDRHFNIGWSRNSACVCSPYKAREFIRDGFNFRTYIDQYVIPFCYAQLYYSAHKKWPWPDCGHYASGILEDYFKHDNYDTRECATDLVRSIPTEEFEPFLNMNETNLSSLLCFCKSGQPMRACHKDAHKGAIKFLKDYNSK